MEFLWNQHERALANTLKKPLLDSAGNDYETLCQRVADVIEHTVMRERSLACSLHISSGQWCRERTGRDGKRLNLER